MDSDMKALRFFLWVLLFLVFYAGFFILYQHGPVGFVAGAKTEAAQLQKLVLGK